MRSWLFALALTLPAQEKSPAPDKTPTKQAPGAMTLARARDLAAVKMLPIIHWCESQQLYGEGKGLCQGILMILPDHKEVRAIMARNPWDYEIPENHYKGKQKELAEFRAKCRAAWYDILQAYQAVALAASKGTLDKRADPILGECDMLVLSSPLLDPLGAGKPAKIKGLPGEFTEQLSRNGVTILTDLPASDQPDVIIAADDAIDAYLQFLDGHAKGIRQKRLPALSIRYFKEQATLDAYCKLNEIANPGEPAFTIGNDSCFRLDKSKFGIGGIILHQAPRLLDPILLPKTTRETAWITEGFACYLQSAQRFGLRIQLGRLNRYWEFIGLTRFFDLDLFCDMNAAQWDALVKANSATAVHGQASALFRYVLQLREGALRARFIEEFVVGGKSGSAAMCELLGVKSLKEIEADFKAYANTLYRQKLGEKEEPKPTPSPEDE